MLRHRLLCGVFVTLAIACSEKEQGTAAGGAAGSAPEAGTGGFAASGGVGGGGTGGGTGGTAGAGADWGASPLWAPLNQTAAGCELEELVNAKDVRVLRWEPCAFEAKCEQAVFNPALVKGDPAMNPTSTVTDDGTEQVVGLSLVMGPGMASAYAASDGMGRASFRCANAPAHQLWSADAWRGRFAAKAIPLEEPVTYGGVIGSFSSATDRATFSMAPPTPGSGAAPTILGDSRWLWRWAPFDRLSSVSAFDGSGFTIFAKAEGQTLGLTGMTTTGPSFIYWEDFTPDGVIVQGRLMKSDGVEAPSVYLAPTDPDVSFGAPAFAHTHIGFMRGYKRSSVNKFETVELWASPFAEQPAGLTPVKLADLASTSITTAKTGGHGRYATPAFAPPFGAQEMLVFDLATGKKSSFVVPPERVVKALLGLTRDHLYIAASKPGQGPSAYLMRLEVP